MKVVNIVQNFAQGGIQKLLIEYLRYFKDNKNVVYKVVVLEKRTGSEFEKICDEENLDITYLNCECSKNKHYYIRKFMNWYVYNFRLLNYLKKEKPDVVHTHNTRMLTLIKTCIKLARNKYKWFHTLHSDPTAVHPSHYPVADLVFNKYHVIPVCLNETQFNKAKDIYHINKCEYLYNVFDQNLIKKDIKNKKEILKELNLGLQDYIIGAVGRLDDVKNYPFLLKVFSEVTQLNSRAKLIICGGNPDIEANDLKKQCNNLGISDSVRFISNRSDIQNIYSILDRFVQTSKTEASSFTVLEAQLFGLKCIVSKAIPIESICFDNQVVRLDLKDDIRLWAEQVLNPTLFEKKRSTIEDYSIVDCSKKLIRIYNE